MGFVSYNFILFLLPASLIVYFALRRSGRNMLAKLSLIAVSLIFYGFYGGLSCALLMIDTVVNWFLSRLL